ncbi:MAG: SufD family Fe-S cluster assembly protein [Clostridiales bacterium]|nr:SufD family Fe-S cluster assembly protein [Clostridiales bacterium]
MFSIDSKLLKTIADMNSVPPGAYNIRKNGQSIGRNSSENIEIISKTDKSGIDIKIAPGTIGEEVHIPVILSESGMTDLVYNDFYIGENCDVVIVAGCGIHNDGCADSRHDGIHAFHIGANSKIKYVEKHYGEGTGSGARILNPKTIINLGKNAYAEMEMVQISGVSTTKRETEAHLAESAKLLITERLMTDGTQSAESDVDIYMDGKGSSCRIISRSVGKENSVQLFHPRVFGNCACKAHVQCDSIIMGGAKISSVPEISANDMGAELVHEAAIGKINSDQLIKLMTFGLSEAQAEEIIIEGFLK